jgi:hypothetical protein
MRLSVELQELYGDGEGVLRPEALLGFNGEP